MNLPTRKRNILIWILILLTSIGFSACSSGAAEPTPPPQQSTDSNPTPNLGQAEPEPTTAGSVNEPEAEPTAVSKELDSCELLGSFDLDGAFGESMAPFEGTTSGRQESEFAVLSICTYSAEDPNSFQSISLLIVQPKPGMPIQTVEELTASFLEEMAELDIDTFTQVEDFGTPAFWLDDVKTLSIYLDDGITVNISINGLEENVLEVAKELANTVIAAAP